MLSKLGRAGAMLPADILPDEEWAFPAGVVALGRGGAGQLGALLRDDGAYIGLVSIVGAVERDSAAVAALAAALPLDGCQFVTTRWPIDHERIAARWQAATRHDPALLDVAAALVQRTLPTLTESGWCETSSYLAFCRDDLESARLAAENLAAALPMTAYPTPLREAKALAGDWFGPHLAGLVTIGWAVSDFLADPSANWAQAVLVEPALAPWPTVLALHLAPIGAPDPVPLEVRRRLQEVDAAIEARRRGGRRGGRSECDGCEDLLAERHDLLAHLTATDSGERPRPARLLLACAVAPEAARSVRFQVEETLRRLGFQTVSYGPRLSRELHLACAPLCAPELGRSMTLTTRGAALVAPIVPIDKVTAVDSLVPLGLRASGEALAIAPGASLLLVGQDRAGREEVLRTWTLGQLLTGERALVVAGAAAWEAAATLAGGAQVPVALHVGTLLSRLGIDTIHAAENPAAALGNWAERSVALFSDLCPGLSDDDRGDLTAHLLALGEAELAWDEPVDLAAVSNRLRQGSGAARHLATLFASTGAQRASTLVRPGESPIVVLNANPAPGGRQVVEAAGAMATAAQAALDLLRSGHFPCTLLVLADLPGLLKAAAGPALLRELVQVADQQRIAIWAGLDGAEALPADLAAVFRDRASTVICQPDARRALEQLGALLGWPAEVARDLPMVRPNELVAVHGGRLIVEGIATLAPSLDDYDTGSIVPVAARQPALLAAR